MESEFRGRESEQNKDDEEDKMVAVEEEGRKKAIKELWWTGTKSVLINVASIIMSITVHGDNSRGEGIISKIIPVEGEILTCDGGGRAYLWLSGLTGEKITILIINYCMKNFSRRSLSFLKYNEDI